MAVTARYCVSWAGANWRSRHHQVDERLLVRLSGEGDRHWAAPDVDLRVLGGAPDAMKRKTLDGFGTRLAAIRQSRGVTQAELGQAAGVSQRVIAYYETESTQPPGALLVDVAQALRVTADELLGIKPASDKLQTRRRTAPPPRATRKSS